MRRETGMEHSDRCLSTGKDREDRQAQLKYKFDPLALEVKDPRTVILLLQCKEKPILMAAATALAKYGSKAQENLECLFDLDIMKSVVPLIEHDDLFTRRFAAKLLAEMAGIPCVRNDLLESDYYIPYFAKVLINEKDTFMQEFSSLILDQLSKDTYGAAQLLKQCPNMDFLFERIQSPDPDVKRNNIEIMYNLMQDPTGIREIVDTKDFNLSLIYELFEQPYPEIQRVALNVISDFVARNKDEHVQELFRQSKGLQMLLSLLDNGEWSDLHAEVLRTLSFAADNSKTVELLDGIGGVRKLLRYLEDASASKLFVDALDVVVRLAKSPDGRKTLYTSGIIDHLLSGLRGTGESDVYEAVCHGIGRMVLYGPAARDLTAENPIKNILGLLRNENLKWSARNAALFALNELLKCDPDNCENFVNAQGQQYLTWLAKQTSGKVPLETQIAAVKALTALGRNQSSRCAIISRDLIDALCMSFELVCRSVDELKIAACNAISTFCVEEAGRDAFLRMNGPKRLYKLFIDVDSIPVRNAAVQLVQLLSTDPVLANAFIEAKFLPYMLNNRISARIIPSWDTCIESLFNSHLPIKFAFTGRLSLHDVTQDGFYVMRRNICPFPVLDDFFRFKYCPLEPVYVVNMAQSSLPVSPDNEIIDNSIGDAQYTVKRSSVGRGIFLSSECLNSWLNINFGKLQPDPYLYDYVELFKCKLIAAESKDKETDLQPDLINISYIASRARMLAEFVVRQMSGPDPTARCMDHQLEIHLKEIKDSIETSLIPLGHLRVGSYLERALLFKVIADRIRLPTALVRGAYGKTWVEIAVPQINHPLEETSFEPYLNEDTPCAHWIMKKESHVKRQQLLLDAQRRCPNEYPRYNDSKRSSVVTSQDHKGTIYPTKLLKPNFIVDLMDKPGDLIPIGSERAKMYCSKKSILDTTCCL